MRVRFEKKRNPHVQRLALLRPFLGRLAIGLFFMGLTVLIQLSYPKAVAYFLDNINIEKNSAWYGTLALTMFLVLSLQAIAATLRYYIFESTGYMIVTAIRRLLYGALIGQEVGFYDRHNVGEMTSRLSSDVEVLHESLTMGLAIFLRSLLVMIGGAIMLLVISPGLSLMLVFFVPASLYLAKWAGKHLKGRAKDIQGSQADCGRVAHEHFTNIRLVHAFNQHETARARYARATATALSVAVASTRLFAIFRGASSFLVYLTLLITLWFGARLIVQGELSVGELTAFILYANMVTDSAGAISDFWGEWMRTLGATERIFEIIDSAQENKNAGSKKTHLQGEIRFDDVVFFYPERPTALALKGVSFSIKAGEKIALVGASGAGKSTIASMILGFYGPNCGRILFDGMESGELDVAAIRDNIAIVEQEPSLFSGTIFENIAFAIAGRDVDLAEVVAAAKLANAHDFIENFPSGYATIVGDRGVQLSGGQKQRIAIARALLRNPQILILDEATSALDSASELQVQNALDNLMVGRTTIIIAHRYSTIVKADRILVMEKGNIVQEGTHKELIEHRDGLYFYLMENQLSRYRAISTEALLVSG